MTPAQQARLDGRLQAHRAGFGARVRPLHQRNFDEARQRAAAAGAAVVERLPDSPAVEELALAMLYVGEGSKKRGTLRLANMDPRVIRYFLRAIRRLYPIDEARLSLCLHLAAAARPGETEHIEWWCQQLGCRSAQFRQTQFDLRRKDSPITADYHGVCIVTYNDTYLLERLQAVAAAHLANRDKQRSS